jgi:rhomboid protease GluP
MLFDSSSESSQPHHLRAGGNRSYVSSLSLVTLTLIAINVIVFLLMIARGVPLVAPTAKEILPWGANFGPLTTSGQWWRLLTACFLHFGIIHIAMNMFILFQVGLFTERLFGNVRFLLLYLLAGIGGNIVGLFFHPLSVGAGASGAIFGVYGGLLGFLLIERGVVPSESALKIATSAGIFLLYNLTYSLTKPEADIEAHVGGLLTGFAAGCLLAQPLTPTRRLQHSVRALSVAAGAALLALLATSRLPRGSASQNEWYRQMMTGPSITAGNKDQLVYSGTATKEDAEKVAQMLVKVGLFHNPQVTMLFNKAPGSASLSMPLKGDETLSPTFDNFSSTLVNGKTVVTHSIQKRPPLPWADPVFLATMKVIGPQLASAAGGPPFTIRLLDSKGELKSEVKIETTEVAAGTRDRVSYSGQATPEDAAALVKALQACGFFKGLGSLVFLAKDSAGPEVSFYMSDGSWNDPRAVAYLQDVSRRIARSVGGPPLKVHLIDSGRQTRKELAIE